MTIVTKKGYSTKKLTRHSYCEVTAKLDEKKSGKPTVETKVKIK